MSHDKNCHQGGGRTVSGTAAQQESSQSTLILSVCLTASPRITAPITSSGTKDTHRGYMNWRRQDKGLLCTHASCSFLLSIKYRSFLYLLLLITEFSFWLWSTLIWYLKFCARNSSDIIYDHPWSGTIWGRVESAPPLLELDPWDPPTILILWPRCPVNM